MKLNTCSIPSVPLTQSGSYFTHLVSLGKGSVVILNVYVYISWSNVNVTINFMYNPCAELVSFTSDLIWFIHHPQSALW